jgi:hypothetical protein
MFHGREPNSRPFSLDGFNRMVLCGNHRAHMAITISQFRGGEGTGRYCARYLAKLAKVDAIAAHRAAGIEFYGGPNR